MDIPTYCRSLDASLTPAIFDNVLGGNWLGLVFVALLGTSFFLILTYFASQLLRISKLEAWCRFEMFQVLATAIIAILLAGWVYGMCNWNVAFLYKWSEGAGAEEIIAENLQACSAYGTPTLTPFCASQAFLQKVKVRGDDIFQVLIMLNGAFSYIFKLTWNSSPMGIGYAIEPLAGFQQLMNVFLVGVSGFILAYLSVLIQMRILDFFLLAVPYYMLPLGLLMRTFEPTREFGGALLGFGIASLFYYPLVLMANDLIVYSSFDQFTKSAQEEAQRLSVGEESVLTGQTPSEELFSPKEGAEQINEEFGMYEPNPQKPALVEQKQDATVEKNVVNFFAFANPQERGDDTQIEKFAQTVFWPYQIALLYVIAAVILPIINLVIYVEVARSLTTFLGTEMDLTNLTRMI
ncbi:MAG: hypothetical protein WC492_02175 [Candidatus Micrarchaeia archaeon]